LRAIWYFSYANVVGNEEAQIKGAVFVTINSNGTASPPTELRRLKGMILHCQPTKVSAIHYWVDSMQYVGTTMEFRASLSSDVLVRSRSVRDVRLLSPAHPQRRRISTVILFSPSFADVFCQVPFRIEGREPNASSGVRHSSSDSCMEHFKRVLDLSLLSVDCSTEGNRGVTTRRRRLGA